MPKIMLGSKKRKIYRQMLELTLKQEARKTKKERQMSQEHQMWAELDQTYQN